MAARCHFFSCFVLLLVFLMCLMVLSSSGIILLGKKELVAML